MTKDAETITAADVGVLDLSKGDEAKVEPYPTSLTFESLKLGMDVVFVDDEFNVHPTCHVGAPHESNQDLIGKLGRVVAIDPSAPGKTVALCMKDKVSFGHSCDGRVPQGHGAYAMPDHLYTVDAWKRHEELAVAALDKQKAIDALLVDFVAEDPT